MIDLVEKNNIKSYVELGVYGGRSLLPVSLAMKAINTNPLIIGVDAWNLSNTKEGTADPTRDVHRDDWWSRIDHTFMYKYTIQLMMKYNLDNVKLYRISSLDFHDMVEDKSLDMLHQDGNHSQEISCKEVELYHNKVRKGGFWIFDDTDFNSTKAAQTKLESYGYSCIHDAGGWKCYQRI